MNISRIFTILVSAFVFAWPITSNASPVWEEACKDSKWQAHNFNGQGECVSMVTKGEALVWSMYEDFRFYPNHQNPSPDQYGNEDVWHYRYSLDIDHDPNNYYLYEGYMNFDGVEAWVMTDTTPYPPAFGATPDDEDKDAVLYPGPNQFSIVSWRSPIEGRVTIVGAFGAREGCGNGVVWAVDLERDDGITTLVQGIIIGDSDEVGDRTEFAINPVVRHGDFVNFIVDPFDDNECDLTGMHLTIVHKPAE